MKIKGGFANIFVEYFIYFLFAVSFIIVWIIIIFVFIHWSRIEDLMDIINHTNAIKSLKKNCDQEDKKKCEADPNTYFQENETYMTGNSNAYVKSADLSNYVKSADLSPYVKSVDLSPYVKSVDLSPYAKSVDLSPYAKSDDLNTYAKSSDLNIYAKSDDLSIYTKSADLNSKIITELSSKLPIMYAIEKSLKDAASIPNSEIRTLMCGTI